MNKEEIINELKKLCKKIGISDSENEIISHPLTSIIHVKKDGKMMIINDEYVDWKCNKIRDSSEDAGSIFLQINKSYGFSLLAETQSYLTQREFSELLKEIWTTANFPNNEDIDLLMDLFKKAKKEFLMSEEDLNKFNSLPKVITIYRGLQDEDSEVEVLSWTLSKEKAEWFANRRNIKNEVYQAEINKSDVFMFNNDRKEEEIVVNPYKLINIKMLY